MLACAFVLLVMPPQLAEARTSLQLEDGIELSFADGGIDIRTGSGELHDVEIREDGVVVITADFLSIEAEGAIGTDDWYIRNLLMRNALVPEIGLFINRTEMRDIAVGRLSGASQANAETFVTEDSFFRLTNLGIEAEGVIVSVDEIGSLPVRLAELAPGNMIVVDGGISMKRMTIMPLDQTLGNNPLIDKLAERGMNSVVLDLALLANIDLSGSEMMLDYEFMTDIQDLGTLELQFGLAVDRGVYQQLLPLLATPEENSAAMLGLFGAIAFESGRLVVDDTGLSDIVFAIAADEEGVSTRQMRNLASMMVAAGVASTFPENEGWLLPPIEAMVRQGGRLTATAMPGTPVPLSSAVGFAMVPDLAISQLGIDLRHQP